MKLAPELARLDRELAKLEVERMRVTFRWAWLSFGLREERKARAELDFLDEAIRARGARRHVIVCRLFGEAHLKVLPDHGANQEKTQHGR